MLEFGLMSSNPHLWYPIFVEDKQAHTKEMSLMQTAQEMEKRILNYYDITNVKSYNVLGRKLQIKPDWKPHSNFFTDKEVKHQEENYIHTISTSIDQNKPNMVFLHGYWSSSLSFVKLIKPLSKHVNIFLIDLPGQALSSRIPFDCDTNEEMIDFFVENIEEWRKELFQDKKIILAGHSFGGFLAGHYALKYEKNIDQIFMISPFGIYDDKNQHSVNKDVIFYTFKDFSQFSQKFIYRVFEGLWNIQATVSEIYISKFIPGKLILTNFLKQTLQYTEPDYDLFSHYYDSIMKMPVSSERCMTSLLKFPSFTAFNPLEHKLKNLKVPIHFFYGENDWMEHSTANRMIENKEINGTYNTIDKCAHNIQFDNSADLVERMIQVGGFE